MTNKIDKEKAAEWAAWFATRMRLLRLGVSQLQAIKDGDKLLASLEAIEHDARDALADIFACESLYGREATHLALERAREICLERELEEALLFKAQA